jgi:hypothetical protein
MDVLCVINEKRRRRDGNDGRTMKKTYAATE